MPAAAATQTGGSQITPTLIFSWELPKLFAVICYQESKVFLTCQKKRSPGRFPEGKVGFPGRFPGRLFHILILLLVLNDTIKQPGAASIMVSENEESETRSTPEASRKGFRKQILKKVTI